jgi:hypothetical protein
MASGPRTGPAKPKSRYYFDLKEMVDTTRAWPSIAWLEIEKTHQGLTPKTFLRDHRDLRAMLSHFRILL